MSRRCTRTVEARASATRLSGGASAPADTIEALITRARRLYDRGEVRRALTLLRQACHDDEWRARTWTILAARLVEAGQRAEAVQAFERARWLRRREGDLARAAVIARLAARAAA